MPGTKAPSLLSAVNPGAEIRVTGGPATGRLCGYCMRGAGESQGTGPVKERWQGRSESHLFSFIGIKRGRRRQALAAAAAYIFFYIFFYAILGEILGS